MDAGDDELSTLQTTCTTEVVSPTMITIRGPNGEDVTVAAEAEFDLILNTTTLCYTISNGITSSSNVLTFAVPNCRLFPCSNLVLPTFHEPAQPPGCCPSPDDVLTFEEDPLGPVCRAVVTFDPAILPGECLRFCFVYSGILPLATEPFTVEMSSGVNLECSTLTVVCPQILPTTTSTTSTTSTTTPPPGGTNWPGVVWEVNV